MWGLLLACFGVLICLVIRFTAIYMRNMDLINEKLENQKVNTVDKYTITGVIEEDVWKVFLVRQQDNERNQQENRPIVAFKDQLKK